MRVSMILVLLASVCAGGCDLPSNPNNPRDPKLEEQRRRVDAVVRSMQDQVDEGVIRARRAYDDAERSALRMKDELDVKVREVSEAAKVIVDHSKKVDAVRDAASQGAQQVKNSYRSTWEYLFAAAEPTATPAPFQP